MKTTDEVALKLSEWMSEKVLEAARVEKKAKLTELFRSNYDYWNQTFFPLIRGQGSAHRQLAEFLKAVGYGQVDESYVGTLMNRIKKERETKGSVKSSSPTPKVQARPGVVAVVTPPVAQEEGSSPLDGMDFVAVKKASQEAVSWTEELEGYWGRFMAQADTLGWNQVNKLNIMSWSDYGKNVSPNLRFAFINLHNARKKFVGEQ